MPTYEFRCPDGTIIERFFKISEVPESIPSPNGDGMAERIISGGGGLLFKGSGFYITDYGKDGKKDQRAQASASHHSSTSKASGDSHGSTSGSNSTAASSSAASSASSSPSSSSSASSGASASGGSSTSGGSTSTTKPE